jgi:NADH-quinone oxidoreductase subunit F
MGTHRKILLKNIDEPNQYTIEGYESRGGYQAARKALGMDPLKVIDEVKTAGLRGRGGAGFPTGQKWSFVPRNTGKPTYLLCNADESEPGTFKDRMLLERDPHMLVEGMIIASHALGCKWACIYIRGEYAFPYVRVKRAVEAAYKKGYLGEKIFGSENKLDIIVHRGAGAYICGEETGLIESLEGKKGQPRIKPPFPAVVGVYKSPTVVNNVETLSALPWILNNGGAAYATIGNGKSTGTKLFSASGHINKPGVYEIEMGYPFLQFIEEECGGIKDGKKLKAVIPGGSSVPILRAEDLQGVTMDYESINKAGSYLGSGGVIVMDETVDMVQAIANLEHFYAHESCGQCTPCREGGHWISKIFHRIASGKGLPGDLELIQSLTQQIAAHTICFLGDSLAMPANSFIKKFKGEFEERIKEAMAGTYTPRPPLDYDFARGHH